MPKHRNKRPIFVVTMPLLLAASAVWWTPARAAGDPTPRSSMGPSENAVLVRTLAARWPLSQTNAGSAVNQTFYQGADGGTKGCTTNIGVSPPAQENGRHYGPQPKPQPIIVTKDIITTC